MKASGSIFSQVYEFRVSRSRSTPGRVRFCVADRASRRIVRIEVLLDRVRTENETSTANAGRLNSQKELDRSLILDRSVAKRGEIPERKRADE